MRSHAGRWLAWIAGFVAVVTANEASAEGAPAALSWVRGTNAQDCASARELAAEVETQAGRAMFVAPAQATMWIEGSIERIEEPPGYVARFGLVEHGDRVSAARVLPLPPVACRELDPLLAFVLAAMLDPDAPLLPPRLSPALSEATRSALAELFRGEPSIPPLELAAPQPEPVAAVETGPVPEPSPSADARSNDVLDDPPETAAHASPSFALFANGGAGVGIVPSIDPVASVEVRWRFVGDWVLRGGGLLWPERSTSPADGASVGFSALLGHLSVCPNALAAGDLAFRLCAGALLGRIATTARGVDLPRDPARPYAAAIASIDVAWSLGGGWWLRSGVGGFAAFLRDRYLMTDADGLHVAHRPSPVGGLLDAGLGYGFD